MLIGELSVENVDDGIEIVGTPRPGTAKCPLNLTLRIRRFKFFTDFIKL